MKRNSDGIGFFSKWMITNMQIAVAFKKLRKLASMLLDALFQERDAPWHASVQEEPVKVGKLSHYWISSYIHCSDISEGRFCQKKIAKSTRSADNHIVHSHIENCLFLFIKHLDFQKWFSIQLETMARGFQYLTLDFCNILKRASHDATESCKLQGFWGSGQILGKREVLKCTSDCG